MSTKRGFTLIDLLMASGIIVLVGAAVLFVINPNELARESRDAKRIGEFNALAGVLEIAVGQGLDADISTSTIYISLVDSTSTCVNLIGLPTLTSPYTYQCVTDEDALTNINGTGWIPIDFTEISEGISLTVLPIDPINIASQGLFYTYQKGSYRITAVLEAFKNHIREINDGGLSTALLEIGSDRQLPPALTRGNIGDGGGGGGGGGAEPEACPGGNSLLAHWDFEEGSGDTATDSQNGNIATLTNGAAWTTGVGGVGSALSLDGTNDYASGAVTGLPTGCAPRTVTAWVKPNGAGHGNRKVMIGYGGGGPSLAFRLNIASYIGQYLGLWGEWNDPTTSLTVPVGEWSFVAGVYNGINTLKLFVNDDFESFDVGVLATASSDLYFGQQGNFMFGGAIDEVRVYDYALSDNAIQNLND